MIRGCQRTLPLTPGIFAFGTVYGAAAVAQGVPQSVASVMSFVVFAGAAQLAAIEQMVKGSPLLVVIVTALAVNARILVYSAGLAPALRHVPMHQRALACHFLSDPSYAVTASHVAASTDRASYLPFFVGSGLTCFTVWMTSSVIGVLIGLQVPESWSLDFAIPLGFIAIMVPVIRDRITVIAVCLAGLTAAVGHALPLNLGVLLGIGVGIALGARFGRSP